MRASPRISIITPTKDRIALLRETMDSVRGQRFEHWEHLVVDDGSEDETAHEVALRSARDPRIRYLARKTGRAGANACRNLGLRESRADLIVLLDSDDVLGADCLTRRLDVLCRNRDLDFAVFRAAVFESAPGDLGRLYHPQDAGDDLSRFLSLECPWQTSGPIWRRTFLERLGGFDESLLSMQDLELHVRALLAGGRYMCFPEVDHHIRCQHDNNKTSIRHFKDPVFIRSAEAVRRKLMDAVREQGLLTWSRQRALAGLGFGTAESWLRAGRGLEAARAWAHTCREQNAPMTLRVAGFLMLAVACLSRAEGDIPFRLVNKWKGRVRFRQDPSLSPRSNPVIQ